MKWLIADTGYDLGPSSMPGYHPHAVMQTVLSPTGSGPVAIGGVGGSGTRLIAQCLRALGFFMGHDLNEADDNLWFALLFTRTEILSCSEEEFSELVAIFLKPMTGMGQLAKHQIDLVNQLASLDREQHSSNWLRERARSLLSHEPKMRTDTGWGWKAPNTHIVLDRLREHLKDMKYIQVVRNGLDMAHSQNQNQLKLWGRHFLKGNYNVSPYYSLKFWCITHRRVLDIGRAMGANFLFLNYDDFCLNPERGINQLGGFLGLNCKDRLKTTLFPLINPPKTIGRFRQHGTAIFDKQDVAYVQELGFDIGETGQSHHGDLRMPNSVMVPVR
jgi:hypothetical protein